MRREKTPSSKPILVGFFDCGPPSVKRFGDFAGGRYSDVGRELGVERVLKPTRRDERRARRDIEVGDLTFRVNPRIRSSRSVNPDRILQNRLEGALDLPLNRSELSWTFLGLPAMEVGPQIGDVDAASHWREAILSERGIARLRNSALKPDPIPFSIPE
jgi:hypothetical protein